MDFSLGGHRRSLCPVSSQDWEGKGKGKVEKGRKKKGERKKGRGKRKGKRKRGGKKAHFIHSSKILSQGCHQTKYIQFFHLFRHSKQTTQHCQSNCTKSVPQQKSLQLDSHSRVPKFTFPFFFPLLKAEAQTLCESSTAPAERISPQSSSRGEFQCRGENCCFPRGYRSHVKEKKNKVDLDRNSVVSAGNVL